MVKVLFSSGAGKKNKTDLDFSPVVGKECHGVLEKI